jgi:glycine cleavage system aminomethyltransferase T
MALEHSNLKNDFGDPAGEARACREDSALFDFTFLDCARVQGPGARSAIEAYIQRPLDTLAQGAIAYAVRTDSSGTALADLTVWRISEDSFEVMSGRREDLTALMASASAQVETTNVGDVRAVFAVQGPGALDTLRRLGKFDTIASLSYFHFTRAELAGAHCTIGRLGYTGEAGFEIILPRSEAPRIWRELSRYSRPAGFIAADTLRIEAGFVLFTNEFRIPVSPAEAGLQQFHSARTAAKSALKLVSFLAEADRLSLPWKGQGSLDRPQKPGIIAITSACNSVVANRVLGLGYVAVSTADKATLHDPSGQFREIRPSPLPFYDPLKRRPRLSWRKFEPIVPQKQSHSRQRI